MTARLTEKAAAANGNGPTAPAPNARQNSDNRRANKPLMEKRRRARINQSLSVLKTLIVDSNKLEGHKHSKLEKADILEMTVTHLQGLRKLKAAEPDDDSKFREGFEECTRQVSKFLSNQQVDKSTAEKLFHHLNGFSGVKKGMSPPLPVTSAQSQQFLGISTAGEDLGMTMGVMGGMAHNILTSPSLSSSSPLSFSPNGGLHHSPSSPCPSMKSGGDPEDNKSRVSLSSSSPAPSDGSLSGIQVIPTRLANGQVVFLLPNGHPQGLAMSVKVERDYASGSGSGSEMEMDEPLDCSNKNLQHLNSPVNLSCKSANQIVPDEDSVWRPW